MIILIRTKTMTTTTTTTTSREIKDTEFLLAGDLRFLSFPAHSYLPRDKPFLVPRCVRETLNGLWHWASTEISTVKVKDIECVFSFFWKASYNHHTIAMNHFVGAGGKLSTRRRQMKLIDANLSPNEFSIKVIKKMSPAGELLL